MISEMLVIMPLSDIEKRYRESISGIMFVNIAGGGRYNQIFS